MFVLNVALEAVVAAPEIVSTKLYPSSTPGPCALAYGQAPSTRTGRALTTSPYLMRLNEPVDHGYHLLVLLGSREPESGSLVDLRKI